MSVASDRKLLDLFSLVAGILVGFFVGIILLTSFLASPPLSEIHPSMMLSLAIAGWLIFMVLWTLAWRNQPRLAFGIFLGIGGACAVVSIVWLSGIRTVPVWLPALPLATVAITLFSFGILAWRWGRQG
jgi:hypothetical protein